MIMCEKRKHRRHRGANSTSKLRSVCSPILGQETTNAIPVWIGTYAQLGDR